MASVARFRTEADDALDVLVRLLTKSADSSVVLDPHSWALVTQHAGAYGVSALSAFAARPFATVQQRAWCDQVLARNWRRYDQSLRFLQDILEILSQTNISPLVLKGPLLAGRHYRPPFLRKSSIDLDLAVREQDIQPACNALANLGYVQATSLLEARTYGHHIVLLHESRPRVELHFRLSHGATGIPVEEFFGHAVAAILPNGTSAQVLGEADEILHLVLHLAVHRFPRLFHLYEIRHIWRLASAAIQEEVIRKAIHHHYVGAFTMAEIAFQATWGEGLLPTDKLLPRTWLHSCLNQSLYRDCLKWTQPGSELTLARRIQGRWLDFQMTDRPSDALGYLAMFASVAWYRLRQGGWRTMRYPHFLADRIE